MLPPLLLCMYLAASFGSANLNKGRARKVLITRIIVYASKIWRHIVSPYLRTRVIASLSDPVLRASMVFAANTAPVYASITNPDRTASLSKREFGGVLR